MRLRAALNIVVLIMLLHLIAVKVNESGLPPFPFWLAYYHLLLNRVAFPRDGSYNEAPGGVRRD